MDKVKTRLAEAVGNIDNDRLQQEFALFIQKSDVDEEFSRLRTHIAEVRRIVPRQGQRRETFGFPDAGAQPRGQHFGQQGHRRRMHASVG